MSNELIKRMMTSIILFIVVIFCILINKIIFLIAVFMTAYLCFSEWCNINYKFFSGQFWNYFLIRGLGLFYLLFPFILGAFFLRGNSFESALFFIIVLCICICSDTGGYVFGNIIGGKKLTKISPNKTISGTIGSFIFSILPIFLIDLQNYIDINFDFSLKNILFCLIISLTCQLGDLFISYFKRLNKVKNTGSILPGHGGLLDRIDGIIFAIPTASILKLSQIF
jgi:phosphatidate cytidylyltransferase